MPRLPALETRSTGAMTGAAQRFRGKAATDYKPQAWRGEKGSESFTAFKMELQNWVGTLHDNMMKVMGQKVRQTDGVGHQECRNFTRNGG